MAAARRTEEQPRRTGRPRDPALDAAILDAALHLLAADGYARMRMDAVAARAGVSKATIYLRYAGKADLATAALERLRVTGLPTPTGDLRTDLVAQLRQARRNAERVAVMALIGTCLTEEVHTPELMRLFRERILLPRRAIYATLIDDAVRDGRLPAGADRAAAVDLLAGAYQARHLSGEPFPPDWEERTVDAAMRVLGAGGGGPAAAG
ncbi:TetR/AcrR family transcriptional regulator [Miltoncostaea marina]|uniref:TetR/AcrR family transcriptional regulator n=1 Tax=Miltoncostaea marina TaxID=2843215 RepID=UPI001C3D74EA|nr:TetR/AcrR family transcriptional regulator [Miltoncostaea marina]